MDPHRAPFGEGSGELVQTLMENDLVDEYGIMINPIVLGSGKRLFRDGARSGRWARPLDDEQHRRPDCHYEPERP
jgi:dihydrofolate reductase